MKDFSQTPFPYNKSVGQGLKILELLSEQGGLSDKQISEILKYNLITVQQLLSIYLYFGYIVQDKDNLYNLSIKIIDISRKFRQRCEIKDIAHVQLSQISSKYNETTTLGTIEKTDFVYVDKIDSMEVLRFVPQIEQRIPAHHTALGKSILAHLPAAELDHYCHLAQWAPYTPKSIDTKEKLFLSLQQIRQQGFAICDEEYCLGLTGIAAAILDAFNYPRFSIGIWGPVSRMTPSKLKEMQIDLITASMEISKYYTAASSKREPDKTETSIYTIQQNEDPARKKGFFGRALAVLL